MKPLMISNGSGAISDSFHGARAAAQATVFDTVFRVGFAISLRLRKAERPEIRPRHNSGPIDRSRHLAMVAGRFEKDLTEPLFILQCSYNRTGEIAGLVLRQVNVLEK